MRVCQGFFIFQSPWNIPVLVHCVLLFSPFPPPPQERKIKKDRYRKKKIHKVAAKVATGRDCLSGLKLGLLLCPVSLSLSPLFGCSKEKGEGEFFTKEFNERRGEGG